MNPYSVKIDLFEGPLDLLLHLINEAEVDIYDIPVAVITDQYLEYIHAMQELELDVASEYLVMAATLLAIKSKMLLPKQEEELFDDDWHVEEEDPRDELIFKLVEYRKYKEAATELKEKEQERSLVHTRPPFDLDPYISDEDRRDLAIQGVSLFDMLSAYQRLLKRKELKAPRMTTVKSQEYSIEDRMQEIVLELENLNGHCKFTDLFPDQNRWHIVVSFLAILELMKTKTIRCEQTTNFSDIMIYRTEEGAHSDNSRTSSND
ncbi:segregation/condensation protein A [Halalkalibacter akibai]|uniref:Segregation and condensation protein A n=1 Tax=Halalkalibacter akibai (strain ATCC 43226 / DSM 21942 / CIP 109018 / JCM 9157 / 1139) TaxID=1236973 RepID=W4QUT0_HALA3|nr:segregation/condensation protein A [Halalkalibacter akibai]GAE35841.1 segregation and condensation protein A [Halalkalibacter akibai JCM 9157]